MYKVFVSIKGDHRVSFTSNSLEDIFNELEFYFDALGKDISVVYINQIDVNKELNK